MIAKTLSASRLAACDDAFATYRALAFAAVVAAQEQLDHIARDTDQPDWRDVEAADLLDAAHELLTWGVSL